MDIFDCWIYIVKNMNMFEQMPFSEKYPVFRKLAEIGDLRKLSREELELYAWAEGFAKCVMTKK